MNRILQLQEFLKESPNDNFLLHAIALEFVKAGDEEKASAYFLKNLTTAPSYIPTYYHYGKLLERSGKLNDAMDIYSKGMDIAKAAGDQHAFSELRSVFEELAF